MLNPVAPLRSARSTCSALWLSVARCGSLWLSLALSLSLSLSGSLAVCLFVSVHLHTHLRVHLGQAVEESNVHGWEGASPQKRGGAEKKVQSNS